MKYTLVDHLPLTGRLHSKFTAAGRWLRRLLHLLHLKHDPHFDLNKTLDQYERAFGFRPRVYKSTLSYTLDELRQEAQPPARIEKIIVPNTPEMRELFERAANSWKKTPFETAARAYYCDESGFPEVPWVPKEKRTRLGKQLDADAAATEAGRAPCPAPHLPAQTLFRHDLLPDPPPSGATPASESPPAPA